MSTDIMQTCIDCGKDFIWTEGEQKYFKDHQLYPPKRCIYCRKIRKEKKNQMEAIEKPPINRKKHLWR